MRKNKGFTLIEVLVAATILFSVITVVSLLFRSSYIASEKAQVRIEQTGVLPTLLNLVQNELRVKTTDQTIELSGEGVIWNIPYQWQANLLEFKAPVDKFDPEAGVIDKYPPRYQLWQVDLVLGSGQRALDYQYQEFSWVN
jgi:prepilin-type N-terminal cleavage/methylation domain-containing protein